MSFEEELHRAIDGLGREIRDHIAQLERALAEARNYVAELELERARFVAELDAVTLERDANHNLAVANGERAKEEDQRATAAEADLAEARAESALQSEARDIALARAEELATERDAAKKRHEDHLVRLSRSLGGLSRYINEQGDYRSLEEWEAFLLERTNQLLHRECDERRRAEAAEAERDRLAAEVERLTTEADYRDLKDHWHSFCDADPFEGGDTFAERMGARGLIELVAVTQDALEDGFAAERGIVPDGYMWQLTEVGRASLQTGEKGE